MTYQDDLRPWAIFRCGEINNICVVRFRKRSDADAYMSLLRQLTSSDNFQVVFDQTTKEIVQR